VALCAKREGEFDGGEAIIGVEDGVAVLPQGLDDERDDLRVLIGERGCVVGR
jgi:hypothetical protein